jgi:Na+/melibiose symporter-like transporter
MLPDVIDDYMIKYGERKESIFYSFYVFFTKFAVGGASGLSALALEFV